jgi:hypothetical protein
MRPERLAERTGARLLALALLGASPLAAGETPALVIEASVRGQDGKPLEDAWVWVVWDRGAPFRFEGDRRRVLNPKGRTGSDGRVRIEVARGFFAPGDPLALAWEEDRGGRSRFTALHRSEDGKRLSFRLEELGARVDFGRLIAPEPRPD